jgi:hypothetical protein
MGLFGSSAPAKPGELSRAQKMQILGATLRDAGAGLGGEEGTALSKIQTSMAAQRKLERDLAAREALFSGVFGGSSPGALPVPAAPEVSAASPLDPITVSLDTATLNAPRPAAGPRPMPTLRDVAPLLGRAVMSGVPGAKDLMELLDKTAPQMDVVNGVAYDKRGTPAGTKIGVNGANINGFAVDMQDANTIGKYFGEAPAKGARPVYDRATGKQTGWEMTPGAAEAIATVAGAEAGGKAAATSGYEMVEIPLANGQKITMPKAQALALMSGGGSPALPGLGVAQSPAEAKAAELAATTAAERAAITPKARAALDSQARTTDLVLNKIGEAIGKVGRNTAGINSLRAIIPGSQAKDLSTTLDTIKANVGFDKLAEMRANSPTGGALGSVSEKENALLQSVLGSIDQGQTPEQLKSNLERIYRELSATRDERKAAYDSIYAAPVAPARTPASAPSQPRGRSAYSVVNVRRAGQ